MNAIVAVVGTLAGTLLGVLGSYFTQSVSYRREADERLATMRRQVYVDWLTCLHDIFSGVRRASSRHRQGHSTVDELQRELRDVPASQTQATLENIRLVAGDPVVARAADLWTHMRRDAVPLGGDRSVEGWRQWQDRYWALRRQFLDAARADLGFSHLNWADAGVKQDPTFRGAPRTE